MNDVDKVKQKLDIVEFIGRFVSLNKAGRNFKGLCPFHNEKSPSFMVSGERQIWHCFGCQKGGDAFSFLMEYEKIDFSESLKVLAKEAGITLTQSVFRTKSEQKKDTLYKINASAAQFYNYLLTKHSVGKNALEYLGNVRGMSTGLIEKFQLGYAPRQSNALIDYLIKKRHFQLDDIKAAGLVTAQGRAKDFFNHRVIFPIHDVRGNIIAFSGRALENETLPKYINTRETLIYKKSSSLYGIYFAKDVMRSEGKVLVVEGEFDAISSIKEGIPYTVALKGTALTEEQIKLLKRYVTKILFCFDTDVAGTSAQKRSIALLEKEGVSASVVIPPEGKDPDELLRENPALFKKAIKNNVNVYDYLIDIAAKNTDVNTPEGKRSVLNETLPIITQIDNEVIKEHYLKKLAQTIDTTFDSVLRQSNKSYTKPKIVPASIKKEAKTREEITETYLLSLILQSKQPGENTLSTKPILNDIDLITPSLNKLWQEMINFFVDSNLSLEDFAKQIPSELIEEFDKCCLSPVPEFEDEKSYANEIVKVATDTAILAVRFKIKSVSQSLQELEKNPNDDKMMSLQEEFIKYTQRLAAIKRAS